MIKEVSTVKPQGCSLMALESSKEIVKKAYNELAKRVLMPFPNMLHAYEIVQCFNGERTLPPADKELFEQTKLILGMRRALNPNEDPLQAHRCATVIRERIDKYLCLQELGPLPQPREHCEFTLFYVVYCALAIDPRNLTQWRDVVVKFDDLLPNTHLGKAYALKAKAFAKLEQLGFVLYGAMHTAALAILHLHFDKLRFAVYNQRQVEPIYDKAIDKAELETQAKIKTLSRECHLRYCLLGNNDLDAVDYFNQFETQAYIALALDPFDDTIPESWFKSSGNEHMLADYQLFRGQCAELRAMYAHSKSMMTSHYKVGRPREHRSPCSFKKWWRSIDTAVIMAMPASDENAMLSMAAANSLATLCRRRGQNYDTYSNEQASGTKRKSTRKSKASAGREEEAVRQFMTPSKHKESDSNQKTAAGFDIEDQLSLTSMYGQRRGTMDIELDF